MPTHDIQRNQWRDAARATRSPLSRPSLPGGLLGSFAALIDHLLSAQTQLIRSYLRIGSSVTRGSRPAPPTATTVPTRHEDDPSTSAPSDPAPAPVTDLIAARAYQIFVQRGGEPGDPVDDWRQAEAELRADLAD
jgi:hypothetical protein